MQMVMDNGLFYEFIPFNNNNFDTDGNVKENPQVFTIANVKKDEDYAILLTTVAGAWRYLIGDVIRFVSVEDYQIQIVGRTKHYLSMCGEHLSVENMNRAIEMFEQEYNVGIREFTVAGIPYESMFAHQWWIGTNDPVDDELLAQKIDEYLKILNDDYRTERLEAIKTVNAKSFPVSVFYEFMKSKGKEGGQHKFPRVLRGDLIAEWSNFLKENYSK
jgi:hypothetical protein